MMRKEHSEIPYFEWLYIIINVYEICEVNHRFTQPSFAICGVCKKYQEKYDYTFKDKLHYENQNFKTSYVRKAIWDSNVALQCQAYFKTKKKHMDLASTEWYRMAT